jgi:hypothetical protein
MLTTDLQRVTQYTVALISRRCMPWSDFCKNPPETFDCAFNAQNPQWATTHAPTPFWHYTSLRGNTMSNTVEARPVGPKDKKLTKVFVLDTKSLVHC